jgi:3D (Asp-Asp-Asp) domain-containing protein
MSGNSATENMIMKWKFTFKEIVFTLIIGAMISGFAFWQGKKECAKKELELKESKQELKETADKLVDALEEIIKKSTPKWEVIEGEKEWRITDGKKEWVYPKHMEFIYSDPNKLTKQWKTVSMNVSAYCPCKKCCEKFADGITASGHHIAKGDVFVAAPRKYPFGTEMVIEGYAGGKVVKVLDVGGAIKGNKLDLFFYTHGEALQWGRRPVNVKVRVKG